MGNTGADLRFVANSSSSVAIIWKGFGSGLQRSKLRKFWHHVHRWLGLTAGIHLILLGLTGSLLVFFKELDRIVAPDRYAVQTSSKELAPLNTMVQETRRRLGAPVHLIYFLSGNTDPTLELWAESNTDHSEKRSVCNFDRSTGAALGCWVWGQTLMSWIYRLHYELFMGAIGTKIVGVTGLVFLFLIFTGLWLWWPRSKSQWATAFRLTTFKNRYRLSYDIHRIFGLYSSLALILTSFSGVALAYPEIVKSIVGVVSVTTPHPSPQVDQTSVHPLFDESLRIAKAQYPGSETVFVEASDDPNAPYSVGLKTKSDWAVKGVLTELWIDPVAQTVIETRVPEAEFGRSVHDDSISDS